MSQIKKVFQHFWYRPARWWQFWFPQSGLLGGLIASTLAFLVFLFFYR